MVRQPTKPKQALIVHTIVNRCYHDLHDVTVNHGNLQSRVFAADTRLSHCVALNFNPSTYRDNQGFAQWYQARLNNHRPWWQRTSYILNN